MAKTFMAERIAKVFITERLRRFSWPDDCEDFHRRRMATIFVVGALRRTVDRPGWLDCALNPRNREVTVTTPAVSARR
jgi:hypothetical protein